MSAKTSARGQCGGLIAGFAALLSLAFLPYSVNAQERGIVAIAEARAAAGVHVRVLVIGAHPDDEDTQLIAWLARGHRAETAYLSLTRGDGGQNLIGNELGEALGVIRTEELLAARRIDGAHQYFTRAYDFGFSKTAAESFSHWPRDSVLGDMVKVVRGFRPHVIVSVFSGTPRDGHGQHQVAGILSREVYDAAADTMRFPRTRFGAPWTVQKLYRGARFSPESGTLSMNVGEYDPILGLTYAEIAAESRSQHKSQGFGTTSRKGVVLDYLLREATRVNASTPAQSERAMFEGIDTVRVLTQADRDRMAVAEAAVDVEAVAERARVALGDSVAVHEAVYRRGIVDSSSLHTVYVRGDVLTQPYWLARPRIGDLFAFASDSISDDAREQHGWLPVTVNLPGHASVVVRTPAVYRYADPVRGEILRPLTVAPGVSVTLAREVELARAGIPLERTFKVTLRSSWPARHDVKLWLILPAGLRGDSVSRTIQLDAGATRTVIFAATGRLDAGEHVVRAVVVDGAARDSIGFIPIQYDHITPERMYRAAATTIQAVTVAMPEHVTVGYVQGVGDNVADALRDLAIPVEQLDPASLPTSDLSRFSTIIVGPRAYQANQSLVDNNAYLLNYVRRGGNLVVQYGQNEMQQAGVMPYPITLARPAARVTDENAPVTTLEPRSPLLDAPNRIGATDFRGWIQERATYMPSTFDPRYAAALAINDPGEAPNSAGLLTTSFGKGRYTYVTLALFRQLPAAVPGAARIFANLLR
ncbi:MAG: PIG-L family deacetylase [Gemmatimonadota bacterium]|nr:PIG-L family deacetylase [Gemmatimonadota bacterium]